MKLMRRVKATSDGTPLGITVITETGAKLLCKNVLFNHEACDVPMVEIRIPASELEYEGLAEIVLVDEEGKPLEVVRATDD